MKRLAATLLVLAFLPACGSVSTRVDAVSSMPPTIADKTIAIQPFEEQNPLRWRKGADILAQQLAEKGFAVVGKAEDAAYVAYFGFAIDAGKTITTAYRIPNYGITGYKASHTAGLKDGDKYSETTTLSSPTYGVVGYAKGTRARTYYTRGAKLDVYDAATSLQVFDGTAASVGGCPSFWPVAPYVVAAMLTNFPQGKVGRVVARVNLVKGFDGEKFEC